MPDINGIPYVESTDLVSAYPAVSLALAQELDDQLASKLDLAGGKILQIVRATDTTNRTTTSATFVDVTGMSVTITPQKSNSAVLIISSCLILSGSTFMGLQITDNSNNAISGAEDNALGTAAHNDVAVLVAYATPATTSAVTFKLRFRSGGGTANVRNAVTTGQLYAIEVSA